jgi:hypothetical protein
MGFAYCSHISPVHTSSTVSTVLVEYKATDFKSEQTCGGFFQQFQQSVSKLPQTRAFWCYFIYLDVAQYWDNGNKYAN